MYVNLENRNLVNLFLELTVLGRETEIQILGEGIPSINVFEDAHKQERFLGERKFLYNSIPIMAVCWRGHWAGWVQPNTK